MEAYTSLADQYDDLTGDVGYKEFADFYESIFERHNLTGKLILDLCCGTGTLTGEMAGRGYEMIGADASADMLMAAREKCPDVLFLCQKAEELDLYGTVDGCICSLDSMNYIPPEHLDQVLQRLHLFIRPGGVFIFDIRPKKWLIRMDGSTSVDENDTMLCLWRADYDTQEDCLFYGIDLFRKTKGDLWQRSFEEHKEYAYEIRDLRARLRNAGFTGIETNRKSERIFISCVRK